jgi:uncharacterized protein (DUF2384 family)
MAYFMKTINYEMPGDRSPLMVANEPEVMYLRNAKLGSFSITNFISLSEKLLLTQAEWADVLHISDRTLQRYLKDNKAFEGLFAEHLYQLEQMADLGLSIFSNAKGLDVWLREPKLVLNKTLDFSTLSSFWGVKLLCNELGRIEHGVYI